MLLCVQEIKWISSFGGLRNHMLLDGNTEKQTEFWSLGKLEGDFGSLLSVRDISRPRSFCRWCTRQGATRRWNTGILTYICERVLFVSLCFVCARLRERAHHLLHYDICWVCVSVALFSPFALSLRSMYIAFSWKRPYVLYVAKLPGR
jgi:hypothetical protein